MENSRRYSVVAKTKDEADESKLEKYLGGFDGAEIEKTDMEYIGEVYIFKTSNQNHARKVHELFNMSEGVIVMPVHEYTELRSRKNHLGAIANNSEVPHTD